MVTTAQTIRKHRAVTAKRVPMATTRLPSNKTWFRTHLKPNQRTVPTVFPVAATPIALQGNS